jgi:hypothetical protein
MFLRIGKRGKDLSQKLRGFVLFFSEKEKERVCVCERKMAHHVIENACTYEH